MDDKEGLEPQSTGQDAPKSGDEIPQDIIPAEVADVVPEELKDIVNDLTKKGDKETAIRIMSFVAEEHYSGALPHPRLIAQFKEVMPDAPERIFRMAEKQQDHRIHLEKTVIEGDVKRADLGLVLGFILFIVFGVGGIILLYVGKQIEGYVALGTSIAGGVVNFIRVGRERTKAIQEQAKKKRKRPFLNLTKKKTTKTPAP